LLEITNEAAGLSSLYNHGKISRQHTTQPKIRAKAGLCREYITNELG